ncbi:uncharacterized protein LOC123565993 [Mercenaria mercenaria]|uniref:uncharacterized protein LOC123565993 n=1 Tax=Mercenaria mercenaria TaxID=6596 RepID=UPI00234F5E42|nr:uncharacterized protein LOC123565993 [Mercenaria mercenaria]
MGNKSSKSADSPKASPKALIEIPVTIPGYSHPEPPMLNVDDIRPPIPWYQDDEEEDEFDWFKIEAEQSHSDEGGGFSVASASIWDTRAPKTPRSVLTAASLMSGPLTNRPVVTPSGRPISFVHQERIRSVIMKRSSSSVSAGAVSLHSAIRRPRTHAGHGELSFITIDEHAIKAGKQHTLTFAALIDYLKQPIRFHQYSDLMTARAIIIWLAYQNKGKSLFVKGETSTPKGLLQLVATERITHAEAYAVLCRAAGLQCVILDGFSKPGELEPLNDDIELKPDQWTAVHVEGDWQIVHPLWMCKGIEASSTGVEDWINKEKESKGKTRSEVVKTVKEIIKSFINEDYFMPAPEVFIHSNYPNDARWQLLSQELTVESREGFLSLPFIFPAFFRLGLRLVTTPSFVLYSKDGKCKIWIATDYNNAHRLVLTFELHLLSTPYAKSEILIPNLRRQVLHCRHNEMFYFEIRFPVEGVFKLEIHGGYNKSHSMKLCYFKLVCENRLSKFRYLPYYPDKLMWGPGPVCEEYGLVLPSKPTGIVKVYEQPPPPAQDFTSTIQLPTYKPRYFIFNLHAKKSRNLDYTVEVHGYHPDLAKELASPLNENGQLVDKTKKRRKKADVHPENNPDYTFCAECIREDEKKQLTITVNLPHEGEFALVIKAASHSTGADGITKILSNEVIVCVYLLRTVDDTHRENVHQKIARNELQRVIQGKSSNAIRNAVDKCIRVKIDPNDDEIAAAQTKAEYLTYRKAVFDAIHRRNFRVINEELLKISKYKHKGALATEIRRLFTLREQLKKLLEFPKYIPELRRAAADLIHLVDPPPEVHLTMGALYLLLEEPDKYIESWEYIVHQLKSDNGRQGEGPIIRKMYLIVEMFPSKNTRRKILTLLSEYSFEQVKRVSVAAAKFYVWVQKVMAVLQDLEFDLELSPNTEQIAVEVKGENMHQLTQPETAPQTEKQTDVDDILKEEQL